MNLIRNIGDVLTAVRGEIIMPRLNCEIRKINERYNDDIVLLEVSDDAIFFNLQEGANVNPIVLIRASSQQAKSNAGQTARTFFLDVFLGYMPDNKTGNDYTIACYRYEEAVLNAFQNAQSRLFDIKYEGGDLGAMQEGNIAVYGTMSRFSCSII
jgi:hypothetical protein